MRKSPGIKLFFYVIGGLSLLIGLWGFYQRFSIGDQGANYGSYVPWGLWVVMYIFFSAISTGSFMVATLDHLFGIKLFKGTGTVALWATIVTLPAGLITIGMDLGRIERIWKVYAQPNFNSLLAQLVWGYTIFLIIAVVALVLAIKAAKAQNTPPVALRVIMGVGLFLAVFLSSAVGAFLGLNASRESWNSAMLPAQFPIFALASGVALMLIVIAWFMPKQDDRRLIQLRVLSTSLAVLLLVKAFYLWLDYSQALYSGSPTAVQTVESIMFGKYGWTFWVLQLGLGMLVPFVIFILPRLNQNKILVGIAGILVLVGLAVARANIIFPALTVPEIEGLANAFTGPHLGYDYFPSLMEWLVVLGVIGGSILAFLIGTDRIPLFPEKSQEVS